MTMMRHSAIALVAFVVVSSACAAQAQDVARWERPGGLFSLDFQSWGWSELPPDPGTDPDGTMLLGIEHRQFQQGGLMRTCFATEFRVPARPGISQEGLNAMVAHADGHLDLAGTPRSLTRVNVDGVVVIDAIYERPLYQHMRWFYVPDQGAVLQIHINCGASGPVSEEVEANITRMLQTLRIRGERKP